MARYQIILAYDGTCFLGSQRQATSRTVQAELEKALRNLDWSGRTVLLAGRTDTGTHACGQVAAFDLDWSHGLGKLQDALNAHLPWDMAVRDIKVVADGFHPRYDATSRRYRYRLYCAAVRDPLRDRYAWQVWPPVKDLTETAKIWLGRHDFSAFGSPTHIGGSTMRTVFAAQWQQAADEWFFEIEAQAFLFRMVRRLVYAQVAYGQGRLSATTLAEALNEKSADWQNAKSQIPVGLAPACGLTLVEVRYDNLA